MITISLKGLWAHKRRLFGTLLAVFLGVAFLSGTLALGDTLKANFDKLFTNANAGTDAVVRSPITVGSGATAKRVAIPAALAEQVRAVPGVADAQVVIQGYGELIGAEGKGIGGNGPPRFAANWITDPALNPYRIVAGRPPQADDEVVINRGAAKKGKLQIGDVTTVQTPEPVRVRIVGLATFGTADGFGPSTYTAFSLQSAERHITAVPGHVTSISVKAAPGLSADELISRLRPVLPSSVEAVTGAQLTRDNISDISNQFLNLLRTFLLVFAAIALLVAAFSIHNTFSILASQRSRETALLRALGASRSQTLASGAVEALLVGGSASLAGLAGGFGFAGLLKGLFDSFGFALPAGGLVFHPSTAVIAVIVGVIATLAAAALPAAKASRVLPVAALREVSVERTLASAPRMIIGLGITILGVVALLSAPGASSSTVLPRAGLGALLTLVGVVVVGPAVARRASALIGWPVARLRGVSGSLARQNAMRNPRRTSGTAAALMVGVGVVTLFTVFAASLKTSINHDVSQSFRGDLAITTPRFGGGLSPSMVPAVAALPQVASATGLGGGNARIAGHSQQLSVVDPAKIDAALNLGGSRGSLGSLNDRQLAVSDKTADDKGWAIGSSLPVTFPDGTTTDLTVGAIYDRRGIAGDYIVPQSTWAAHAVQDLDTAIFVTLKPGVPLTSGTAAVNRLAAAYGGPAVQDRHAYAAAAGKSINSLLGLIYVMLTLAIIIALLGISNTLSLSTNERTHELGLLRAVGQTRAQLRSMVRWESLIVALFGTVGGLGLGVFLGWVLVQAANQTQGIGEFTTPTTQLLVLLIVGAVAGILAGVRPARRAGRLDVLAAIASE